MRLRGGAVFSEVLFAGPHCGDIGPVCKLEIVETHLRLNYLSSILDERTGRSWSGGEGQ